IHIDHAIDMVLERGKPKVGMIGLSFKTGTDDLRESPMVTMAERFIGKGLPLTIYDPEVHLSRLVGANRQFIEETIPHIASLMSDDVSALITRADVLIVGLKTPEVLTALGDHTRASQLLLDIIKLPNNLRSNADYRGVCW